jgi:hypothetical protein
MAPAQSLASRVPSQIPPPQVPDLVLDMTSRPIHLGAWTACYTGLVAGSLALFFVQSSVLGKVHMV